ncbi:hypothetical protein BaRGS_00013997 [Batillaria attramentaria]|uniref:Uncharacterized protein n=1 Tax=Batillaria attramentaria TaxID=370345 RepID=A0ABD0L6C0_9CAEN
MTDRAPCGRHARRKREAEARRDGDMGVGETVGLIKWNFYWPKAGEEWRGVCVVLNCCPVAACTCRSQWRAAVAVFNYGLVQTELRHRSPGSPAGPVHTLSSLLPSCTARHQTDCLDKHRRGKAGCDSRHTGTFPCSSSREVQFLCRIVLSLHKTPCTPNDQIHH